MDNIAEKIERILLDFKIKAKVENIIKGGNLTKYNISLSSGIKVNKVINLNKEIALGLKVSRVEIDVNDNGTIGISVPNEHVNIVKFENILKSVTKNKFEFVLGKNIDGDSIIANIKDMIHMLVAGSTGSGKSVFINTMICSLISKNNPENLKLILIDPKKVELSAYKNIPHLLSHIITEPKDTIKVLNWLISEVERRYEIFESFGVRDIDSYNNKNFIPIPRIVVFIDEFADLLMMSDSKLNGNLKIRNELEMLICRIAQKARAAGVHLIIATQRPDREVITGLIKSNLPSKIAFSVSSSINSKIILDETGAEKLLGKGDMLFYPVGEKTERVQGAYISDYEIENAIETAIETAKTNGKVNYDESLMKLFEIKNDLEIDEEEYDYDFESINRIGYATKGFVEYIRSIGKYDVDNLIKVPII